MTVLVPRVREPVWGLCRGPASPCHWGLTGWVCRPVRPTSVSSAPRLPSLMTTSPTLIPAGPRDILLLKGFKPFPRKERHFRDKVHSSSKVSGFPFSRAARDLPWPLWGGVKGRFSMYFQQCCRTHLQDTLASPFIRASESGN